MSEPVLGRQVPLPTDPASAVLVSVPAPADNIVASGGLTSARYVVRFTCPEFTSLCPVTGQPDFANIVIDYQPKAHLIESKSLKLFLGSFRNHGDYHEACTTYIGNRLFTAAQPYWIRVVGLWYPRGGIPIDIVWECGERWTGNQFGITPLPIDIPTYRGR